MEPQIQIRNFMDPDLLHPDDHGHVQVVTVGLRDRQRAQREAQDACTAGLRSFRVPVLVILPAEERPPEVFMLLLQAQTGGDGQELRPELPDQGHLNPQHGPVEEDHARRGSH